MARLGSVSLNLVRQARSSLVVSLDLGPCGVFSDFPYAVGQLLTYELVERRSNEAGSHTCALRYEYMTTGWYVMFDWTGADRLVLPGIGSAP